MHSKPVGTKCRLENREAVTIGPSVNLLLPEGLSTGHEVVTYPHAVLDYYPIRFLDSDERLLAPAQLIEWAVFESTTYCKSCNEQGVWPFGYCDTCYNEHRGNIVAGVRYVMDTNESEARRRSLYHDSMPEGQRSGKRHTSGG